nr:MAG TPA_asm: hypothetical protein [Caudoviricetes sp.]
MVIVLLRSSIGGVFLNFTLRSACGTQNAA